MLTPYTYCHLINISKLFYPTQTELPNDSGRKESKSGKESGSNPNTYAKLKKMAQFSGQLKRQRQTIKYLDKYYAILASGFIFFFKEEDETFILNTKEDKKTPQKLKESL